MTRFAGEGPELGEPTASGCLGAMVAAIVLVALVALALWVTQ